MASWGPGGEDRFPPRAKGRLGRPGLGMPAEGQRCPPMGEETSAFAGGLFVKTPEDPGLSKMVTEEEIRFYEQQFKRSGFRGPLNWYRNTDRNWRWGCKGSGRKILVPALMITAEKDVVLTPEMSKHMEDWIPHLKRGHIKDCGHWTQMEKPAELNQILITWLENEVRNRPVVSKI